MSCPHTARSSSKPAVGCTPTSPSLALEKIARRLQRSSVFAIDVRPVTDSNGLVRKYLSKERTPQAGYGREHVLDGRLKGSHRLEGGGDRVRLSRALERDAIEASYVATWQHSNARRSFERRAYRPRTASLLRHRPGQVTTETPSPNPLSAPGNVRCQP